MHTPRELFLISGHAPDFKKLVASESLEPACLHALAQLQSEMPANTFPGQPTDPYVAIDANAQMHGARRVIEILLSLHEPPKSPLPPKPDRLNYAH